MMKEQTMEKEPKNIFQLQKRVNEELKKGVEDLHTGLVGEQLIIASYKQMPLQKLEAMRTIINHIIKNKKEMKRVQDAKLNNS